MAHFPDCLSKWPSLPALTPLHLRLVRTLTALSRPVQEGWDVSHCSLLLRVSEKDCITLQGNVRASYSLKRNIH